jgi:hypothetical protein
MGVVAPRILGDGLDLNLVRHRDLHVSYVGNNSAVDVEGPVAGVGRSHGEVLEVRHAKRPPLFDRGLKGFDISARPEDQACPTEVTDNERLVCEKAIETLGDPLPDALGECTLGTLHGTALVILRAAKSIDLPPVSHEPCDNLNQIVLGSSEVISPIRVPGVELLF